MGQLSQHIGQLALDIGRLGIWLILLMAIFIPLERISGLRPQKVFRKAFSTDVIYFFLSGLLPKLLLILPMTALAWVLHRFVPSSLYSTMAGLPVAFRFAAAMFVGEVGAYWGHRWSHEIPLLWRFHAIHHSAEEIDWLVHTRAHPVDMVFTRLCAFVPMYALGLAQPMGNSVDLVPVLVTIVGTVWGFFIHANVSWRFGWLESLLSSPAFHHWHHTNDGPEVINKNYSAMLPWVDRCFGTFYLPRKDWPGKYGIDGAMSPNFAVQIFHPLVQRDEAPKSSSEQPLPIPAK